MGKPVPLFLRYWGRASGGSSASPKGVRALRSGTAPVMNATCLMSPPRLENYSESSFPTRVISVTCHCWRRVVRVALLVRVNADPRGVVVVRNAHPPRLRPACRRFRRWCRDGFSQAVIHRKHSAIPTLVIKRGARDRSVGPRVKQQENDTTVSARSRERSRTTPDDSVGGLLSGRHKGCVTRGLRTPGASFCRRAPRHMPGDRPNRWQARMIRRLLSPIPSCDC